MFKRLSLVLFASFLTACASTTETIEKEVPVYIKEVVVITVPENLLVANKIPKPPSKSVYLDADWSTKENLLVKYSKEIEKELLMCVADKKAIKKNIEDKLKLHEEAKEQMKEATK